MYFSARNSVERLQGVYFLINVILIDWLGLTSLLPPLVFPTQLFSFSRLSGSLEHANSGAAS